MAIAEAFSGTTFSPYANSLISGSRWTGGAISYSLNSGVAPTPTGATYVARDWTASDPYSDPSFIPAVLANAAAVCNVTFDNSPIAGVANLRWLLAPGSAMLGDAGIANLPVSAVGANGEVFDSTKLWILDTLELDQGPGSYGYWVMLHELGHALGLLHPGAVFTSPTEKFGSVMAYDQKQGTYMAFDIAALQALYGANTATGAGNDTYTLPDVNDRAFWSCIWDAGGTADWISNAGGSIACTIDLRSAPLTGPNAAGFLSRVNGIEGGFTIANGVTIENAYGGVAGDVLIGNDADNRLDGSYGADTMQGGLGNDTYVVDNQNDVVIENPSEGWDTVRSSLTYTLGSNVEELVLTATSPLTGTGNSLANRITGNSAANWLYGNEGNDSLFGGAGDDHLFGGTGADSLVGGSGNDYYNVDSSGDVVTELPGEGNDTVEASVSYTLGAQLENLVLGSTAAAGTGNELDNMLTGTSRANALYGMAGADTLDGGAGGDLLVGGTGNDTYIVDCDTDVVKELAGEGVDTVLASCNYTLGSQVENLVLARGALIGTGNTLANTLTGNAAANTLYGADANDTLMGGGGADSLDGGAGNDLLVGGAGADTLNGGAGSDTYHFAPGDSGVGAAYRDTIFGFTATDFIDLRDMEVSQHFTFIGTSAFNGGSGQLRAAFAILDGMRSTVLEGDLNGDGHADFEIALTGVMAIGVANIVL